MAEKKKTTQTTATMPDMEAFMPGMAGMMSAMNPVAAKAWLDLMTESTEFMTERVNSTVALQQQLMASRDPAEMMQLQTAYVQETMTAWSAEMTRYAALMMASASDVAKDAQEGHKRGYDDVPV